MTDDVVALLDQWIAALKGHPAAWAGVSYEEVQRARDEIVALRETVERQRLVLSAGHAEVRDEALEEAARIAEHGGGPVGASIAKSIRARVTPGTPSAHWVRANLNDVRDQTLEEAAQLCERRRDTTGDQSGYAVLDVPSYMSACSACAYDIRALKEKSDG